MTDSKNDRVTVESASAQSKTCTSKTLRKQENLNEKSKRREKPETNSRTRKVENKRDGPKVQEKSKSLTAQKVRKVQDNPVPENPKKSKRQNSEK